MGQTRVREGKHPRRLPREDPEGRALRCLARLSEAGYPSKPIDALQQVSWTWHPGRIDDRTCCSQKPRTALVAEHMPSLREG